MDTDAGRLDRTAPGLAQVVDRNIQALLAHRQEAEGNRGLQQRMADVVTGFAGSMLFVYLHLLVFGLWIMLDLGWLPGAARFAPSLEVLAVVASVEALFLTTFVLISQNRMTSQANKRAELDLQMTLIAEYEITRLITLVTAMATRMGMDPAQDRELAELSKDVAPEEVMEKVEAHERAADQRQGG